jgi:hypothetical protein
MSLTLIATRSWPTVSWRFELEGQLELGADAVGAGHQHRLAEFLRHFEQRAEAADAGQHLGRMVRFASGLMRSTSASPASISTPASR